MKKNALDIPICDAQRIIAIENDTAIDGLIKRSLRIGILEGLSERECMELTLMEVSKLERKYDFSYLDFNGIEPAFSDTFICDGVTYCLVPVNMQGMISKIDFADLQKLHYAVARIMYDGDAESYHAKTQERASLFQKKMNYRHALYLRQRMFEKYQVEIDKLLDEVDLKKYVTEPGIATG